MENHKSSLGVYWCRECNVPLISEICNKCGVRGFYTAIDMKPVFAEERKMYEEFFNLELPDNLFISRNRIILDGKTLLTFKMDFHKMKLHLVTDQKKVKSRLDDAELTNKKIFMDKTKVANNNTLNEKTIEAIKFIKDVSSKYNFRYKVISFSGGKDSTVTADLVKKAIGNVPLFFADTTLEYDETIEFIKEFANKYNYRLIFDENGNFYRNERNIWDMIEELGPPSIPYRWCCSVFKAYPVNLFHKKEGVRTLAFDGIRKYESLRRKKYEQVSRIKKISNQIAVYPIFYWKELDVWFYIFFNDLIYNPIYNYGHRRVGCWICPNASPFNCFIRKKTHPEKWKQFEEILLDYAYSHGRDKNWVIENYWRLRRPKKEVFPKVKKKKINEIYSYIFDDPIDGDIFEFLKPLGEYKERIISTSCPENPEIKAIEIGSGNPIYIESFIKDRVIKVQTTKIDELKSFEKQLLKAINCVGCGGCIGYCPNNALYIKGGKLAVDDSKCIKCQKCLKAPCVSLNYRIKKITIVGG